jgi:hypothetical protein
MPSEQALRFQKIWFGEGPGRDQLVRAIAAGRSHGANAHTSSGDLVEEGRPFDAERMRRRVPLYTPFHYECGCGHKIDSAVVLEMKVNSGIHYAFWCERDAKGERCSFDNVWAYQVWDPADEYLPEGRRAICPAIAHTAYRLSSLAQAIDTGLIRD